LALHAQPGSPPLSVNSSVVVKHLDSAEVGGIPAPSLQQKLTGGCAAGIASATAAGDVMCAAAQVVVTGSSSWVVPSGVRAIDVQAVGAGGGGASGVSGRAGGGGAGATAQVQVAVRPGQRLDVVIGHGGPGGTSGARASAGEPTVVYRQSPSGSLLVRAGGGRPGTLSSTDARCRGGAGGIPGAGAGGGDGVVPVLGQVGVAGSCGIGGGAPGYPGTGGSPAGAGKGSGDRGAVAGDDGIVIITLAD
jgi:hypothetical protein